MPDWGIVWPRSERNAILVPSGDQDGCRSSMLLLAVSLPVILVAPLPSALAVQMSLQQAPPAQAVPEQTDAGGIGWQVRLAQLAPPPAAGADTDADARGEGMIQIWLGLSSSSSTCDSKAIHRPSGDAEGAPSSRSFEEVTRIERPEPNASSPSREITIVGRL